MLVQVIVCALPLIFCSLCDPTRAFTYSASADDTTCELHLNARSGDASATSSFSFYACLKSRSTKSPLHRRHPRHRPERSFRSSCAPSPVNFSSLCDPTRVFIYGASAGDTTYGRHLNARSNNACAAFSFLFHACLKSRSTKSPLQRRHPCPPPERSFR